MALLSIIIPVFNKEEYIDSCMDAVLHQTFQDFEIIIVNDGSADKSGEKCDFYASVDKRVRVVHQKNSGVSSARNHGLSLAQGHYIGFIDCDDLPNKSMYQKLIKNAIKYDADVSMCGVEKKFPNKTEFCHGSQKTFLFDREHVIRALFRREIPRSVYDKVYKASIAKKLRFEGSINEDIYYNFLYFTHSEKFVFYDTILYSYIIRENSSSMAGFNKKFMDPSIFSDKMLKYCAANLPALTTDARVYDFITHLSTVNLMLLSDARNSYSEEYQTILTHLKNCKEPSLKKSVGKKHRYAYWLLRTNDAAYAFCMKLYWRITNSYVVKNYKKTSQEVYTQ